MESISDALPNIRPASDLRTKFTQVMNDIYQSGRPVFLTKKGRCDTVIMSAETFSNYELTDDARAREFIKSREKSEIRCSFCGKAQNIVEKLIAGPNAYICNECIELCVEVIEDVRKEDKETRINT